MEARCRACCAARVCMRSLPFRRLEREIGGFVAFAGCITLAPPLFMTIQDKHTNPMADNDGAPRGHRCVPEGGGVATGCVAEMDADAIPALDGGMATRVAARRASIREQVGGAPLEGIGDRWLYRFAKRAFDIIFSLLVLVCFCWLYAIIAILVKADDPKGPVIFSQDRVGKGGRVFRMHKFRSMCVDAEDRLGELESLNEKSGPVFKIKDDPRVTRVGHWLRKLSLDELPQFWDVLKGDIPLRILKTRQGFSLKMLGAFALPARLARTRIAASLQVRATICATTGVPQNLFQYFIAGYGEMREVFAKRGSRIDFPLLARFTPVLSNGLPI